MKTIKSISKIALLGLVFLIASCSSDSDDGGGSPSGFFLKAKIDGSNYSSYVTPTAMVAAGTLIIQSSTSSGNSIQIQIPNYNGVGTYTSGNNNLLNGYINYMEMGSTIGQFTTFTSVRGTGTVEITAVTETQIEGTFTATAVENVENGTDDVAITQGTFRAEL